MIRPWLQLFRVVNLPTVPGDVLVGAAACGIVAPSVAWAALASVLLYMFGLVDNDIVGAATDHNRPIPDGAISLAAARIARGLTLFGVLVIGALANLPPVWWMTAFALAVACVVYNRTKWAPLMGLCRGLNVMCGGVAVWPSAVWTAYITLVTLYSEGEENDPSRRRRVGFLVGGIIYLQLAALIALTLRTPQDSPLLVAGGVLLIIHRILRRFLPHVSAS